MDDSPSQELRRTVGSVPQKPGSAPQERRPSPNPAARRAGGGAESAAHHDEDVDDVHGDDVRVGSLPAVFHRWRRARVTGSRGSSARIRAAHRQARAALRLAVLFIALAALAGLAASAGIVGRWLPLHLFLAGGVGCAVSGLTLMLTVSWSAAPAPNDGTAQVQRLAVAGGAAGVALGQTAEVPLVTGLAGVTYLAGLLLLAVMLVVVARDGSERRFDAAVAGYVGALVMSVFAVGVGVDMAVHQPNAELRSAHVVLNLLGYVGLVIGGTLPFFGATMARAKMARRVSTPRLLVLLASQVLAVLATVVGLLGNFDHLVSGGLTLYAYGVMVTLAFMPGLTVRQMEWAGPRLLALWLGSAWWIVSLLATAYESATRDLAPFAGRWLLVLVVGGYAQVVWGALAYLLPMLRGGGHQNLSRGFASTRSWVGLGAVNVAALALVVESTPAAVAAAAVWAVDGAWRAHQVGLKRLPRPDEIPGEGSGVGAAV